MTMRYCQGCGQGHDCEAEETGREKAEVAIERLRTQRDIEVARLTSQAGVKVAEADATHAAAHAEGVEEGIGAVLEASAPDIPETSASPVIVEAETAEVEPELEPEMAPPETGSPVVQESGGGWWDGYR